MGIHTINEISFDDSDILAKNTAELISNSVKEGGNKPAFSCVLPTGHASTMTYSELGHYSDAVAVYLKEVLGLKKGDVVAVQSPNILSYPVLTAGIFKAGLMITNINPLYTADETNHQLKDSNAKIWFVIDVFGNRVEESVNGTNVEKIFKLSLTDFFSFLPRVALNFAMRYIKKVVPEFNGPLEGSITDVVEIGMSKLSEGVDVAGYSADITLDDVAVYQYTGGTTGRSKGAELTHGNIVGNISQFAKRGVDDFTNEDCVLLVIPLYHVYAMAVGGLSSLQKGLHVVLVAVPRPVENIRHAFEKFNISIMPAVNTLYLALLQEPWFRKNPPKGLKLCSSGAAPLQLTTAVEWEKLTGVKVYEGYGLTESTCVVSAMPYDQEPRMGSCGRPLPGTEVRIVGADGQDMPVGESGELLIRGPQVMRGYLNNPEATKATIEADGWLHTGDIAKLDEDGYLYIVDRLKDMIIVSGFNVYPADIEEVITKSPKVSDAAVVGAPDSETGERVVAFVVPLDKTLTQEEVISHCKEHLTNYKIPKTVILVDDLPKSAVGKVLRRELRDQAKEAVARS